MALKWNCPNCNTLIETHEYIYSLDCCKYCVKHKKEKKELERGKNNEHQTELATLEKLQRN